MDARKISEIAEVLPGYALKTRAIHDITGTHQMLLARHLDDGNEYRYTDDHCLRFSPKTNIEKYLVKTGDILFVSRGIHNHACPVVEVPKNTVATSTLYIIRPVIKIYSNYLAWCINQPGIQLLIDQVRTRAATPIIQRADFGGLCVPVPSHDVQQQIVKLDRLLRHEIALQKILLDKICLKQRTIGEKIMSRIQSGKG